MRFGILLGVLVLVGCGQEFCVGPFGNCSTVDTGDTSSSGLSLKITLPKTEVDLGEIITLTASGGTSPYTWSIVSSSGGNISYTSPGTTATFTAPTIDTDVRIKLEDDNSLNITHAAIVVK